MTDPDWKTEEERIMQHFNQHATCKRRRESRPQIHHEPGCTWVCCEANRCACSMVDGGDLTTTGLITKWEGRHGR